MRFRTRTFLLCFFPFGLLFAATFWMAQRLVQSTVRTELLTSLRASQLELRDAQSRADLQNSRFLTVEGQSPELQAGMQSLLSDTPTDDARTAMETQLRTLGDQMGLDLLFVSTPEGTPLVGVVRQPAPAPGQRGQLVPVQTPLVDQPARGMLVLNDRIFQFASAPIGPAIANLGTLSVGEYFDLPQPSKPTVLVHDGEVIDFNLAGMPRSEVQVSMKGCAGRKQCEFRLRGAGWIGVPMEDLGGGYTQWTLKNIDEATGPIRTRLRSFFLMMEFVSLAIALLCGIVSSLSIQKPISLVISQLRKAEQTGVLPVTLLAFSSTKEMRELTETYTRAAVSARHARQKLQSVYLEFIGSLANALDARDRYTAGHSRRVSQYARATAAAMGLDRYRVEQIRIAAQLHDIGKIGVPDSVLQKPGELTAEEIALVQEHTIIGRRILEGVEGLAPFLDAVELHHENWDGTGYPRQQCGEQTPIDARIIHVTDAYDAMTSDRSYRAGMTHQQAIDELLRYAGIQFDPQVVDVFVNLPREFFSRLALLHEDHRRVYELAASEVSRA